MKLKVPLPGFTETLRFVGADQRGSDLHVPVPADTAVEALLGGLAD